MGRIVFAWEFGGGLGHIKRMLPLALMLEEMGHEVHCVMKHVIDAAKVMGPHGLKVLQAPLWQMRVKQLTDTYNYAETLFNFGYLVPEAPFSNTTAWRNLFQVLAPDLLIADHAPTALIAARTLSIKAALIGTGFCSPPRQSPMPSIIPWENPKPGLLEYSEKKAVQVINDVLGRLRSLPINNLHDLFAVEEDFLVTFKELDHYQTREQAKYWGPVLSHDDGDDPKWPGKIESPKIFCYLKSTYLHIKALLSDLKEFQASIIVYVKGLPEEEAQKYAGGNIFIVSKPLNMHTVCRQCDLVVCHGGHGTVAISMLHGKPLVLLPEHKHLEQILLTQNIVKYKAGQAILTQQPRKDFRGTVARVLQEPLYRERAKDFAGKYRNFDGKSLLKKIARRCEEIVIGEKQL